MQITNREELDLAIQQLKLQKMEQQKALAIQFKETYESFKPANILKRSFSKITESGSFGNTALKIVGGIGTGLLTKGLLNGKGGSLVGGLLRTGASAVFYNNADKLKAYGSAIFHNLFKKGKK